MRRGSLGAALAAAILAAATARAQPAPVSAAEHFDRGVRLAAEGDLRAALVEFQAAYDATQNPEVLFNIAAAHERLNEYVEAREALERYQRLAPPDAVARRREAVVAALGRLAGRIGTLRVRTSVASLRCAVDGTPRATDDLQRGVPVSAGRREVRCEAEGRDAVTRTVDVQGGGAHDVEVEPPRRQATITVVATVRGAAVLVDGREVGRTPLAAPVAVDEGAHRVEVRHPGYEPATSLVDARGVGARVDAVLRWHDPVPAAEAAWLVVRTNEPGGLALLDGRRVPMDGSVAVPPGAHRLRVERADFVPAERDVDLAVGERRTEDVRLAPTDGLREAWTRRARSRRLLWTTLGGAGLALTVGGAVWFGATIGPLLDANARFDENQRAFMACGTATCALTAPEYARLRDAAGDESARLTPQVVAGGVIAGVGLVAVVVALVLWADAPAADRFDRPPVWQVGVGPGGSTLRVAF